MYTGLQGVEHSIRWLPHTNINHKINQQHLKFRQSSRAYGCSNIMGNTNLAMGCQPSKQWWECMINVNMNRKLEKT